MIEKLKRDAIPLTVIAVIVFTITFLLASQEQTQILVLETNQGTIKAELYTKEAPKTTAHITTLVNDGFYDEILFHRVIQDFMIQTGDPLTRNQSQQHLWGTGGSDEGVEDEFSQNLSNTRGTLSMANAGPNTATSQFFINVADNTFLDFNKEPISSKHAVFGEVIEGLDVVDAIAQVQTNQRDQPEAPVIIERAYIE